MTGAPSLDLRESVSRAALRWGACMAAVLLAHGAIAAGLLTWPEPRESGALPAPPILIDLADAAMPQATIEDVSKLIPEPDMPEPLPPVRNPLLDMAPTPEPPPEVKIEVTIEIPPPEPPPPVDLKPPPPKEVQKPPPKPPEKVITKRTEPSRAPPSPAPVADQAAGTPMPGPVAPPQPNPNTIATWKGAIMAHLLRYKRYPRAAQSRGDEGTVYVHFTIARSGQVLSQQIVRPSGKELLDAEATDMFRRMPPFPPAPADLPGPVFEFNIPIQFGLR
jgi:protein TonB